MTLDVIVTSIVSKRVSDINYREAKKVEKFNHEMSLNELALAICIARTDIAAKLTVEELAQIILNSGGICAWCAENLPHEGYHFDHIRPYRLGGRNTVDNIVMSCERCNKRKQDKSPLVWIQQIFAETGKITNPIRKIATDFNIELHHTRSLYTEIASAEFEVISRPPTIKQHNVA